MTNKTDPIDTALVIGFCDSANCTSIHIWFHDKDDNVSASVAMDKETAARVVLLLEKCLKGENPGETLS